MIADFDLMSNERLGDLLFQVTDVISDKPGRWVVQHGGRRLIVVTDEKLNRMRIMTPVAPYEGLKERDVRVLLAANFDRTLDARYATAGGYLWSAYLHPLSELGDTQVQDALEQVVSLADNFGGSYAASDLVFTGGQP